MATRSPSAGSTVERAPVEFDQLLGKSQPEVERAPRTAAASVRDVAVEGFLRRACGLHRRCGRPAGRRRQRPASPPRSDRPACSRRHPQASPPAPAPAGARPRWQIRRRGRPADSSRDGSRSAGARRQPPLARARPQTRHACAASSRPLSSRHKSSATLKPLRQVAGMADDGVAGARHVLGRQLPRLHQLGPTDHDVERGAQVVGDLPDEDVAGAIRLRVGGSTCGRRCVTSD